MRAVTDVCRMHGYEVIIRRPRRQVRRMKPTQTMAAYWLASIRRFAAGATTEGVSEDDVVTAALEGVKQGRATTGDGR